jgi:hypothetical protein
VNRRSAYFGLVNFKHFVYFALVPHVLTADHPLRRWRWENDRTLSELAQLVAYQGQTVTAQHLSDIELGDRWPGALLAQAIQCVTGLSLELLVTYRRRPRRRRQ